MTNYILLFILWKGYGLDGLGFECQQGQEISAFCTTSVPDLWPIQPPVLWVPGRKRVIANTLWVQQEVQEGL